LWSRSAAADYGQVGPGGVTATRRDEHRLVRVIELVLEVIGRLFWGLPGRDEHWLVHFIELVLDVPGSSTFSGSSVFSGVGSPGLPGRDEHWLVRVIELVLDVPGSSTFSGSSVFSGVGSPGLPGRGEHWLVHFIELVLDVPRKRDQEARRSPVVAFQSNNPKVMRLQIERLGCCSSRWGARMSLGRALRAFW